MPSPPSRCPGGTDQEMGRRRGADADGVAGARDAAGRRVSRRHRLAAGRLERDAEGALPLVNVLFAGNTAWLSLLVKCTVPL